MEWYIVKSGAHNDGPYNIKALRQMYVFSEITDDTQLIAADSPDRTTVGELLNPSAPQSDPEPQTPTAPPQPQAVKVTPPGSPQPEHEIIPAPQPEEKSDIEMIADVHKGTSSIDRLHDRQQRERIREQEEAADYLYPSGYHHHSHYHYHRDDIRYNILYIIVKAIAGWFSSSSKTRQYKQARRMKKLAQKRARKKQG